MALRRRHCQGVHRGRPAPGGEPDPPRPLPRHWRQRPGGTLGLPPGAPGLGGGGRLGRPHGRGPPSAELRLPSAAASEASRRVRRRCPRELRPAAGRRPGGGPRRRCPSRLATQRQRWKKRSRSGRPASAGGTQTGRRYCAPWRHNGSRPAPTRGRRMPGNGRKRSSVIRSASVRSVWRPSQTARLRAISGVSRRRSI